MTNASAKRVMEENRANRGNRCEECGFTEELEFHHVKPTGLSGRSRGYNQRAYDIRNHPDCYVLVCRLCHIELHPEVFHNYSRTQQVTLEQYIRADELGYLKRNVSTVEVETVHPNAAGIEVVTA